MQCGNDIGTYFQYFACNKLCQNDFDLMILSGYVPAPASERQQLGYVCIEYVALLQTNLITLILLRGIFIILMLMRNKFIKIEPFTANSSLSGLKKLNDDYSYHNVKIKAFIRLNEPLQRAKMLKLSILITMDLIKA